MNTSNHHSLSIWLIAWAALTLLLSACQPVIASTSLPPVQPTNTQPPIATQTPDRTTQPTSSAVGDITLNLSGVAQNWTVETIAAVPASAEGPWWAAMPEYRRVSLQAYPVTNHQYQPQIFIYPAGDLASANQNAGKVGTDLQELLQTRQNGKILPFLPLINAGQVIHPRVQYLDFMNGKGVRFLAQFNQGLTVINNHQLIYTFQGLTSDGKHYIAAVLPVTHPELPPDEQGFAQSEAELSGYSGYITKTITWLAQQPSSSFTPDLAKLDALVQSLDVK